MAIRTEAATTTPLRRVADIDAHLRMIVEISRIMNMTATDAILTAKQASERACGFAESTGQIRRFTRQLEHSMDEILRHISRLGQKISSLGKDDHVPQYIEATREMSYLNRTLRGLAALRRENGAQHAQDCVQEDWIALGHELHHAFLLLQAALGLAQSANVEPGYGREMVAGLMRAVGEIDAITQRVMAGVKQFDADMESE